MIPPDLTLFPSTDPISVYRLRDGIYTADLLAAALVGLDLFSYLAKQPSDLESLCQGLSIHRRPTDVMMTLFTALGYVENRGGSFHLTAVAREYLTQDAPFNVIPYYASMKERPVTKDYLTVLRTGRPSNWASYKDEKAWAQAMENEAFAKSFTSAMDCRGVLLGPALAKAVSLKNRKRVLDVAGGSGVYACALVANNPGLSACVLEKSPVDRIARKCIEERGFSDRVTVVEGEMFQSHWPQDADVHLLSNVLHDWDEPQVLEILRRSFQAMPAGGLLMIHDVHLNAEKTGPLPCAQYSALLMCITEGKCYSRGEMESYLRSVGYVPEGFRETLADRSVLLAVKP